MDNVKSVRDEIYEVTLNEYDVRCRTLGCVKGLSGLYTWLFAYEALKLLTLDEVFEFEDMIKKILCGKYLGVQS